MANARAPTAKKLTQLVKSYVGISVTVEVQDSGSLERSTGKAKHVTDTRPKAD
ncbi:MAG: hypothetical protein L0H29_08080 [Sinobacteraceae bacterium]|nr:hypothetical protein [Nevskiaceae bacterium]